MQHFIAEVTDSGKLYRAFHNCPVLAGEGSDPVCIRKPAQRNQFRNSYMRYVNNLCGYKAQCFRKIKAGKGLNILTAD